MLLLLFSRISRKIKEERRKGRWKKREGLSYSQCKAGRSDPLPSPHFPWQLFGNLLILLLLLLFRLPSLIAESTATTTFSEDPAVPRTKRRKKARKRKIILCNPPRSLSRKAAIDKYFYIFFASLLPPGVKGRLFQGRLFFRKITTRWYGTHASATTLFPQKRGKKSFP